MRLAIIATVVAVPFLMGNQGGCTEQNTPTMQQIELNVPAAIRSCPRAPASPGAASTPAQRARYLLGLYNAWEVCHGNVNQMNALIKRWERVVAARQGK